MSRKVRITALTDINREKGRDVKANLDWTCWMIDKLSVEKPDIVCLTETFDTRETPLDHPHMAQTLEGETVSRMKEKAKEYNCYIICAFIEQRDNGIYNTAAVIDRGGNVIGKYDKIHPTISEVDDHVLPGACAPSVIQTDFGKIGCMICFDANWPGDWKALKDAGAEIIFFPSAFSGGRILQSLATIYNVPIVCACFEQCCRIIDRDGLIINRQGVYQKWVTGVIDLDNPLFHLDFQFEKVEAIRKAYGPDVHIQVYEEEGWWRVLPQRLELDILDIIKKYELETLDAYIARSTSVQDKNRLNA
ncbi:MAG: carbon-nitrogen hydrolase family protein [Candidatus Hydrogenedentes bacterium]|nr:carbon-nitrogen hydrolase family protein [Candidatus Hydrogenedentota bacterium]